MTEYKIDLESAQSMTAPPVPIKVILGGHYQGEGIHLWTVDGISIGDYVCYLPGSALYDNGKAYDRVAYFFKHTSGQIAVKYTSDGWEYMKYIERCDG